MGWPEMAGKWPKNWKLPVTYGGRRRRFSGPIPARPAAVGREISRYPSLTVGKPDLTVVE